MSRIGFLPEIKGKAKCAKVWRLGCWMKYPALSSVSTVGQSCPLVALHPAKELLQLLLDCTVVSTEVQWLAWIVLLQERST